MPVNSLIIGVDLSPIKAIPKVITFQSDITTEKCRATIRQHLKTWKADTVLHDGAPNVGTAWTQDSFNQAELTLQAMKLATEFLIEGGTFVTKVFRSKDYNPLLWVFNQLFTKVEATKPPSSRNVSAEIFVVCRGFKAPKKIDPRFLDPRSVFAELSNPTPNNEAKVYNPETKKRKREGYEEGDYIQFKEVSASEFIQTVDPIAILGSYNRLAFEQPPNGDVALAALDKLPQTTDEIRSCCSDLRLLGRKDFKLLLKWRLEVREIFGFPSKKTAQTSLSEEVAEVEPMDEELKIQEELQALKDKEGSKKKREKRKENEKKQKDIVRMQLNMVAPMDIGMEQGGPLGEGQMFNLKAIDKTTAMGRIARGKMAMLKESEAKKDRDSGIGSSGETDDESDAEEDQLDRQLDSMYEDYSHRKAAVDAKYRAKRAREEHNDDEWEGVSVSGNEESENEELDEESGSDSDDESESLEKPLMADLDGSSGDGALSKRATNFFNQDIFQGMEGILGEAAEQDEDEDEETDDIQEGKISNKIDTKKVEKAVSETNTKTKQEVTKLTEKTKKKQKKTPVPASDSDDSDDGGFEVVKNTNDDDWENKEKRLPDGRLGKSTRTRGKQL
jgi:AdoMet-dependent rRNA methyltransferase SPB1